MRKLLGIAILLGLSLPLLAGGGAVVELDKLTSKAPANWKAQEPENKFRSHQFAIPKVAGDPKDAEVVIFFFGPGSGGSTDDNIKRWKKMFIPAEGKSIEDVSKVETFKVGRANMTYLDVNGTYVTRFPPFAPNAKEEKHANSRMLGVVFDSEGGPYFIRLVGPAKTVAENKKGFDEWIKAFK